MQKDPVVRHWIFIKTFIIHVIYCALLAICTFGSNWSGRLAQRYIWVASQLPHVWIINQSIIYSLSSSVRTAIELKVLSKNVTCHWIALLAFKPLSFSSLLIHTIFWCLQKLWLAFYTLTTFLRQKSFFFTFRNRFCYWSMYTAI